MPSYKNMDICLPELKRRLALERDPNNRVAIQIAINIITALPCEEIQEGQFCKDCYFYARESYTCLHKYGLRGKVRPTMYCYYGSKVDNGTNEDMTEDFAEFSEDSVAQDNEM